MNALNRRTAAEIEELLRDTPLRPVRAVMVEQRGACDHALGDAFTFARPWDEPDRPMCPGLVGALRPFLAAAAAGIPADRNGGDYYASCPSGKGTVWRIEEGA
ncbi:MAG: hypothetical protein K0R39_4975 [Symbiobacteriaceae bacterium]|nr:hypothetical protein [Symbiobacteriaceae bacterium]